MSPGTPGETLALGTRHRRAVERFGPGVVLSLTIAGAASFVATGAGGPVMLLALLIGMAFHFLHADERFRPGLDIVARNVLKIGVALLGVRITISEIAGLGFGTLSLVIAGVTLTILFGWSVGRALGLKADHAVLSGGATAICGASAALAISAVLPRTAQSEQNLGITVVGVTTLSTVAMVVYPAIASLLGLSDTQAGIFLGATIHDVAQVVGAGFAISNEAGETATIVKLLRVAMLAPAVFVISMVFARVPGDEEAETVRRQAMPVFLVAFLALCAIGSAGWIPPAAEGILSDVSRGALVAAVAALGVKTSLQSLMTVGLKPILCLSLTTAGLALFVLAAILLGLVGG
ncbi:YeiH family protein [Parvularcula lutaonensis]|uniref:YeiH family protein n=1 Tax=Parvularcula lutaonensis TaxID=491923 RepID=A0ABV7M7E8_9PROT|nr:putative sulfate exporter family transporter [Parvularcula lutaonensis]GGY42060.1 UPF0324 membrane protein [Parvularcula lutaonensis]